MKPNLKSIAVLSLTAFLAFAPPGTLIFLSLLIVGLTGKIGLIVIGVFGTAALAWLFIKKKRVTKETPTTEQKNQS